MRIRAGFEISYECVAPTPMLFMLNVRPERLVDLETPDQIRLTPALPLRSYQDLFGNTVARVLAPPGRLTLSADFIVRDSGAPDVLPRDELQRDVDDLPDDTLIYLLGSRYCDTEALNNLAWKLFGGLPPGWPRVEAVLNYVHGRIGFGYEHARPTRTAWEAHEEQLGVCRDYAHLAVTLCRCLNIPARYCTGYLGDIGIAPVPSPMDFSAWFQVYLGDDWHTVDARHNTPRIGRILMAWGRDAADVAISTSFGQATLVGFSVVTEDASVDRGANL